MTAARIEMHPQGPVEPLDRRVIGVAWVGVGGLALAAVYQLSGGRLGIPCLLHVTTGLDCPLCGSTRMAAALLRGDLDAAWHFNPVVLLLSPVIGVAVGYQLLAWLLERARLVRLPRLRPSRRTMDVLLKVGIAGMVLFGVLRNF
ncbi:DUF2752 domain-containing protein [Kribbella sp. NBC_01245]|uniref:DUF2752 domain-containing protein n=1 Tax=Kribbella sp. NBC_01245 TaxID=2903578 RepID=UPI002E2A6A85|nr:DUF2752 domain-containing protein [Kribbella sp. NBC_01245]